MTTSQKDRYSYKEALEYSKVVQTIADISPDDPDLPAKIAQLKANCLQLLQDRSERRKIANKKGQAVSAAVRKERTEQRNAIMREAIMKLLEQGVTSPSKISKALIAQDIRPPKATRWSIGQLRTVVPEIPKREPVFPR